MKTKIDEYATVVVLLVVLQLLGLLTTGWLGTGAIVAGYMTGDALWAGTWRLASKVTRRGKGNDHE